ncbi:hypothetical protein KRZ98_19955 [Sphingobium sp. AS12]|nr:hypothetical protein [Sphingobium sp. AS12]
MIASASGRPLRFFGLVMVGWVAMRLWSQPGPPLPLIAPQKFASVAATRLPIPPPMVPGDAHGKAGPSPNRRWTTAMASLLSPTIPAVTTTPATPAQAAMPVDLLDFIAFSMAFANRHYATDPDYNRATPSPSPAPLLLSTSNRVDRWHGSAWMLWRDNGTSATDAAIGRLGASQAGLRIDYDLTPAAPSRTVAYARATSALQRPAAPEAAIGLAIQPVRTIPVSLAVERRIALGEGARNATTVMAVGGFGPTPVGYGLEAEAYAQAGMVGFNRRDAFIDGKVSLLSPVSTSRLRIGAALSGGAQPGVGRLDIGPEMQVRLPLPNAPARIAIEWRERVAGRAAPASGLAITLAADF